jgi:hypothetical protein
MWFDIVADNIIAIYLFTFLMTNILSFVKDENTVCCLSFAESS